MTDARVDPLSESANRQQAEHLREMLLAQCEELDADLATYGSALERYQRRGEQTQARRIRGMIRAAERERRAVQDLIAGLEKRFLTAARTDAVRHPQSPPGARHGIVRVHPHPSPHRVIRT
jgi:predicted DNA-binding protein